MSLGSFLLNGSAVFGGGETNVLFEAGGKIKAIRKSTALGNVVNAKAVLIGKELLCMRNAKLGEILVRRFSGLLLKATAKIILVVARFLQTIRDLKMKRRKILIKRLLELLDLGGAGKADLLQYHASNRL